MLLSWWKILGILIFTLCCHWRSKCAIKSWYYRFESGPVICRPTKEVTITAYNTHFKTAQPTRIWLKSAEGKFWKHKMCRY